jgi:hypothetical protein
MIDCAAGPILSATGGPGYYSWSVVATNGAGWTVADGKQWGIEASPKLEFVTKPPSG